VAVASAGVDDKASAAGLPSYPERRMRLIAVCWTFVALALFLTSTSCATGSAAETGVVQGTLEAVGGPVPGPGRPLKGSIKLRDSDGTAFTATVGSDGVFVVRVPIGTYAVTGRSPLYEGGNTDCFSSGSVLLGVGATIHVIVMCEES
jgi:hypothetical protein